MDKESSGRRGAKYISEGKAREYLKQADADIRSADAPFEIFDALARFLGARYQLEYGKTSRYPRTVYSYMREETDVALTRVANLEMPPPIARWRSNIDFETVLKEYREFCDGKDNATHLSDVPADMRADRAFEKHQSVRQVHPAFDRAQAITAPILDVIGTRAFELYGNVPEFYALRFITLKQDQMSALGSYTLDSRSRHVYNRFLRNLSDGYSARMNAATAGGVAVG